MPAWLNDITEGCPPGFEPAKRAVGQEIRSVSIYEKKSNFNSWSVIHTENGLIRRYIVGICERLQSNCSESL